MDDDPMLDEIARRITKARAEAGEGVPFLVAIDDLPEPVTQAEPELDTRRPAPQQPNKPRAPSPADIWRERLRQTGNGR